MPYEKRLRMSVSECGREEGVNGEIREAREGKLRHIAILAEGILKPKYFPGIQIEISQIWPD